MHDTIDLLEAIGRDASPPHADGDALVADPALDAASVAFRTAILRGRGIELLAVLGAEPMQTSQGMQMPRREDEGPDQKEGDEPTSPAPYAPEKI